MVLMKETRNEIEQFYSNFNDIVDEVSVTQYSERGGNIETVDKDNQEIPFIPGQTWIEIVEPHQEVTWQ